MTFVPLLLGIILFGGLLAGLEVGRRYGLQQLNTDPEGYRAGNSSVEAALFGLLGLLVAFSFSGAASRFDHRRQLIVSESNAIGTAWLRLDLLPAERQATLRDTFRRYVDSRIAYFRALPDLEAAQPESLRWQQLQQDIWTQTVQAAQLKGTAPELTLTLPAINEMIDITLTRALAGMTHTPPTIFGLLTVVCLICAFLAGNAMAVGRRRNPIHGFGFALVLAATFFVIVDLEFPRGGLIRITAADELLVQVRENMK